MDVRQAGIPVFMAVGAKEAASGSVALRRPEGSRETLEFDAVGAALRSQAFK